jgi:YidC/Oxa1 family membrane protein insertase
MQPQRNFLLFITVCLIFFLIWLEAQRFFWPTAETPPPPADETQLPPAGWDAFAELVVPNAGDKLDQTGWQEFADRVVPRLAEQKGWEEFADLVVSREGGPTTLVTLGDAQANSPFHLRVVIDPRGAGVRSVILNKFMAADEYGRPMDRQLELIPEEENKNQASFLLYHYDPNDPANERPLDTLGRVIWHQVGDIHQETNEAGQVVAQTVAFEYVLEKEDVKITKIFQLKTGDYNVDLAVRLERLGRTTDRIAFRYQLAGPHGLPIEGRWYTSVFRNAVISLEDKDKNITRELEDSRQIGIWGGGTIVQRQKDPGKEKYIRYAGVAVQFFASVIAVNNHQDEGIGQDFLAHARATLEVGVTKGTIKAINPALRTVTLSIEGREDQVFHLPADFSEIPPPLNTPVAIISHIDGKGHDVVRSINADPAMVHAPWVNDITVRVVTEPAELTTDKPVVHRYVLYNGPVKPRLLAYMSGNNKVEPAVIEWYTEDLGLRTLVDYQSSGTLGWFASSIGWTWLVIRSTNLMHWVFGSMNHYITNLGLSIILLTVLVRGLMFPISRKGALTSLKMQELAPEINKIKEKFGDDRQAAGLATMQLYNKHGVSPLGTCWFMLLQMPIFMGLYFALQESITFRLATFWPTWVVNLAAPDMLFRWGEQIPFISRVQDYGGWLYLGPFLNVLPIVAVALMVVQQKMVTPPPTDEQQEMQQKMMKYMMVIMGFMFYKVAAGLAIYFIASSLWGFAERALLPRKKKTAVHEPVTATTTTPAVTSALEANSTAITSKPAVAAAPPANNEPRGRNRKQGRNKRGRLESGKPATPANVAADTPPTGIFGWWRQRRERIAGWWREILEQAEKKNRTERKK